MRATTTGEMIAQLEARIEDQERRIASLERRYGPHYPNPSIPVMPAISSNPRCGKCGIELTPVMGYCCPRTDCPCGLGSIICFHG